MPRVNGSVWTVSKYLPMFNALSFIASLLCSLTIILAQRDIVMSILQAKNEILVSFHEKRV
jgi:hypothetical protein